MAFNTIFKGIKSLVFLSILLSIQIQSAFSQDNSDIQWKPGCNKNQRALNECAYFEWVSKDKELNTLYQEQIRYLGNKKNRENLILAQQLWVKFRDADCLYQTGTEDLRGSTSPYVEYVCKYKHTLRRIEDINAYLQCRVNGCLE